MLQAVPPPPRPSGPPRSCPSSCCSATYVHTCLSCDIENNTARGSNVIEYCACTVHCSPMSCRPGTLQRAAPAGPSALQPPTGYPCQWRCQGRQHTCSRCIYTGKVVHQHMTAAPCLAAWLQVIQASLFTVVQVSAGWTANTGPHSSWGWTYQVWAWQHVCPDTTECPSENSFAL